MILIVIITIYGVTIQSCSGAWVLLIIILAIVCCTGLFLCFLHLFNSVPFENCLLCLGGRSPEAYGSRRVCVLVIPRDSCWRFLCDR